MKTIQIALAFVLSLALTTGAKAQQAAEKEQLIVPLSEPGKPFKLNARILNGSIKVVGYEGKDIVVDIADNDHDKNKKGRNRINININGRDRDANTAGMKRITAGRKMDVSADESNNTVNIRTDVNSNLSLTIKVPMNESKMKLSSTNDGEIVVNNVNGELEVNNTNGPITMTNISGSVVADALNEDIKVSFKSIDPKAAMAFSSLNGNIDLTFPATLKANVKLKTDRGDMFTDFDIDADKTANPAKKTSQNGVYRINIENWVYGKINTGGPELMIKNMNGNIYIRKAK